MWGKHVLELMKHSECWVIGHYAVCLSYRGKIWNKLLSTNCRLYNCVEHDYSNVKKHWSNSRWISTKLQTLIFLRIVFVNNIFETGYMWCMKLRKKLRSRVGRSPGLSNLLVNHWQFTKVRSKAWWLLFTSDVSVDLRGPVLRTAGFLWWITCSLILCTHRKSFSWGIPFLPLTMLLIFSSVLEDGGWGDLSETIFNISRGRHIHIDVELRILRPLVCSLEVICTKKRRRVLLHRMGNFSGLEEGILNIIQYTTLSASTLPVTLLAGIILPLKGFSVTQIWFLELLKVFLKNLFY